MRFRALGSGSSGNATLVESGETRLLIDAGLGPRILAERLLAAGVEPASLSAVLISHEHSDHSAGAPAFSHKWGVELAGTRGTYAAAGFGSVEISGYRVLRLNAELVMTDPHAAVERVVAEVERLRGGDAAT